MRRLCSFVILLFSQILVASAPSVATEQGVRFLEAENPDAAFRASYSSALKGNPKSQYVIGTILIDGQGASKKDINSGVEFLDKSAAQNYAPAAIRLGNEYQQGKIVASNDELSLRYLLMAETAGDDSLGERILDLTISVKGEISEEACARYTASLERGYERLALCVEAALTEGLAGGYWLASYKNGNANGLINSVKYLLDPATKEFSPKILLENLEGFYSDNEKPLSSKLDAELDRASGSLAEGKKYRDLRLIADELRASDRPTRVWLKILELAAEGSGKANVILADMYRDGDVVKKSSVKELTYVTKAVELNIAGLGERKHSLEKKRNPISKNACKGYNKMDRSIAITLAQCADKGHIKGDPVEYRLWAFEDGNTEVLVTIAPQLIDRDVFAFSKRLIGFFEDAPSRDQTSMLRAIQRNKDKFRDDPAALYLLGQTIVEGTAELADGLDFLDDAAKQGDVCGSDQCKTEATKAALFIANNYRDGRFTVEDRELAIEYYTIAESYGADVATDLRSLLPDVSPAKCRLLDKFDPNDFADIAKCTDSEVLIGHKAEYWLKDFQDGTGDVESFLIASERIISEEADESLEAQLADLVPKFHKRARSTDVERFIRALSNGPFNIEDCQTKSGSLGLSSSGNPVRCVLLAETGDEAALLPAISIWEDGANGLSPDADYAQLLFTKQKEQEEVDDLDDFFQKLQSDPREYYLQAKQRLEEGGLLTRPAISKALGYLMAYVVDEDYTKFAKKEADVTWVLEYVDWNEMADRRIAESLWALQNLQNDAPDVVTERALDNQQKLSFSTAWLKYLDDIDPNTADVFLVSYLSKSCDALNFGLDERRTPAVFEAIKQIPDQVKNCANENAKTEIIVKPNDDKTQKRKSLVEPSVASLDTEVTADQLADFLTLQDELSGPPSKNKCSAFGKYLTYKDSFRIALDGLPLPEMVTNEGKSIKLCRDTAPAAAASFAEVAYRQSQWNQALKYGELGCENGASKGCGIAARVVFWHQTKKYRDADRQTKKRQSVSLAKKGWEQRDLISGFVYFDHEINTLCTSISGDCPLGQLSADLKATESEGWRVREIEACITNKGNAIESVFKALSASRDCSAECGELDKLLSSGRLDAVSEYKAAKLLRRPKCKKR